MANKITIVNKQTLMERVKGVIAIGFLGLSLYGLYCLGDFFVKTINYSTVMESIIKGDFVLAKRLLETSNISAQDKTRLEFFIEKQSENDKYLRSIEENLSTLNFDGARNVLNEAKTSRFLNREDLANLERIIYDRTEEGFFESFNLSDEDKQAEVAKEYLKIYSEGKHKNFMIKGVIESTLSALISDKKDFRTHYAHLTHFNLLLNENQITITQEEMANIDELSSRIIKSYSQGTVEVGAMVEVVYFSEELDGKEYDYVLDRNENFNIGSVGEVVGINGAKFFVKFPNERAGMWNEDYNDLELFWKSFDTKDIARYKISELKPTNLISEEDKNSLMSELNYLTQKLNQYKNEPGEK